MYQREAQKERSRNVVQTQSESHSFSTKDHKSHSHNSMIQQSYQHAIILGVEYYEHVLQQQSISPTIQ